MGDFINFVRKKLLRPTLQFCEVVAGEGSALILAVVLFTNAQPHVWHIMDAINVSVGRVPTGKLLRWVWLRNMFTESFLQSVV